MKKGKDGLHDYLNANQWVSDDLKTIEHVAPDKPSAGADWDARIYENELHQSIGNLTLLPVNINSSVNNSDWKVKLVYYKHLSESDPDNLAELLSEAKKIGVDLKVETIELLKNTSFKHHLNPILGMDSENNNWNSDLIEARTERICQLVWGYMSDWLNYTP